MIREGRERKGWTQKQLADAIGVTPGFITKLETDQAYPSYERCIALADSLDLSLEDLWAEVEQAKTETLQQRIRTRGAAVRGALRTRGGLPEAPGGRDENYTAEEIGREILRDPDLKLAYRNLKLALSDPKLRPTVLTTLEALARTAGSESGAK